MMLIVIGGVFDNNLVLVYPNSAEGKEKVLLFVEEIEPQSLKQRTLYRSSNGKFDTTIHFVALCKCICFILYNIEKPLYESIKIQTSKTQLFFVVRVSCYHLIIVRYYLIVEFYFYLKIMKLFMKLALVIVSFGILIDSF